MRAGKKFKLLTNEIKKIDQGVVCYCMNSSGDLIWPIDLTDAGVLTPSLLRIFHNYCK